MHASNVYLYLRSFIHEGIVEQDEWSGHYGLGPGAIQLGAAALRQSSLIDVAKDDLARLRERTGNSVMLSVWGNCGPTVIFKIDGGAYTLLGIRVGYVLPILTSTTGRVFIAYLPEENWADLVEFERTHNITLGGLPSIDVSTIDVSEVIAGIRSEGVASLDGTINGRYPSCAAPAFDSSGNIVAVLTMLIHQVPPVSDSMRRESEQEVIATAEIISSRLGYRGT